MKSLRCKAIVCFWLFVVFVSCEKSKVESGKGDLLHNKLNVEHKNAALNEIALATAKAVRNSSFRILIKEEVLKKYDGDFDVLFQFIKDKDLNVSSLKSSTDEGHLKTVKVGQLIAKNLGEGNQSEEDLQELISKIDNLQLSVPVNVENWVAEDYEPLVAILPADYDEEKTKYIKAYDKEGKAYYLDAKEKPLYPVVVIGEAERVDERGKLAVDEYGVVVDESDRISIEDAYAYASGNGLKSFGFVSDVDRVRRMMASNFVEVIEDDVFSKMKDGLERQRAMTVMVDDSDRKALVIDQEHVVGNNSTNVLKSTERPSTPENVIALRGEAKEITVTWKPVTDADYYWLYWRWAGMGGYSNSYRMKVDPPSCSETLSDLVEGRQYWFAVSAVDDGVESYLSSDYCGSNYCRNSNKASLRTNNGWEILKKIYISNSYYNRIEGWPAGDLELDIRIGAADQNGVKEGIRKVPAQIASSDIKGETYEIYYKMFKWDVEEKASVYKLYFLEDDGGNNKGASKSITIRYEKKFEPLNLNVAGELKLNFDDKDEEIGEMEVRWWDKVNDQYDVVAGGFKFVTGHYFDDGNWNSKYKCPYIGKWDGANCYVGSAPNGSYAAIYMSNFAYITFLNGVNYYATKWKEVPPQVVPFVYDNKWYVHPGY